MAGALHDPGRGDAHGPYRFPGRGTKLHKALDICGQNERKVTITGRDTGATSAEFGQYLMATVEDAQLDSRWEEYVNKV